MNRAEKYVVSLAFFAVAAVAGAAGCSANGSSGDKGALTPLAAHPASDKPREDGLYIARAGGTGTESQDGSYDYLRFLTGGRVLTASSNAAPERVASLLFKNADGPAKGVYQIKDGTIEFKVTSKLGEVAYEGYVHGDNLEIRWRSAIDGVSEDQSYQFVQVQMDDDDADGGAEPSGNSGNGVSGSASAGAGAALGAGAAAGAGDGASTGWFCFHAGPPDGSFCAASAGACETLRANNHDPHPGDCAPAKSAFCRTTSTSKKSGDLTTTCYPTAKDCSAASKTRKGHAAPIVVASCVER